jgi:hypothetical protein
MPSQQVDLFEFAARRSTSGGAGAGRHDVAIRLRKAIRQAISGSPKSREQLADELTEKLGAPITKAMLDTWTAESKPGHRFPAEYLPALTAACGDPAPLELLADAAGYRLVSQETFVRSEIARLAEEERRVRLERKLLERLLRGRE